MTVYVVLHVDPWTIYGVVGVFSSEENARLFISQEPDGNQYEIEPVVIDAELNPE